jgi:hypothetical protein
MAAVRASRRRFSSASRLVLRSHPQLLASSAVNLVAGVACGKLRKYVLGRPVCLRVRRDGVEFAMRTERKGLKLKRQLAHHRGGHVVLNVH